MCAGNTSVLLVFGSPLPRMAEGWPTPISLTRTILALKLKAPSARDPLSTPQEPPEYLFSASIYWMTEGWDYLMGVLEDERNYIYENSLRIWSHNQSEKTTQFQLWLLWVFVVTDKVEPGPFLLVFGAFAIAVCRTAESWTDMENWEDTSCGPGTARFTAPYLRQTLNLGFIVSVLWSRAWIRISYFC